MKREEDFLSTIRTAKEARARARSREGKKKSTGGGGRESAPPFVCRAQALNAGCCSCSRAPRAQAGDWPVPKPKAKPVPRRQRGRTTAEDLDAVQGLDLWEAQHTTAGWPGGGLESGPAPPAAGAGAPAGGSRRPTSNTGAA